MDKTTWKRLSQAYVHPEFFTRAGSTDPEAILENNLCLILKNYVVRVML